MHSRERKPNTPPLSVIALIGPRGLEIAARHPGEPTIAVFTRTLPSKLEGFQAAYQRVHELESAQAALFAERDASMRLLRRATRGWLVHLRDGGAGLGGAGKLERALDALFLQAADVIHGLEALAPDALHTTQARADLAPKLATARAAYDAADAGQSTLQGARRELRTCASELHKELIKLRTALRVALGASHSDYELLRAPRTRNADQPGGGRRLSST